MNIVDLTILVVLLIGAIIGFNQGAIKKFVSFVGVFVIIVIAFILKNDVSVLFYENLPFLDFGGMLRGIQVLNIIFYEVLAFLVVFTLLSIVLKIVIAVTGLAEMLLKLTIFLALPSKLLGMVVGLVEYYVYTFIVLLVLTLPVFNVTEVNNSKYANSILNNTPILSGLADDTIELYTKVYTIIDERDDKTNKELNQEVLDFMLSTKSITYDSAKNLIDRNKVLVEDKTFIEKYK